MERFYWTTFLEKEKNMAKRKEKTEKIWQRQTFDCSSLVFLAPIMMELKSFYIFNYGKGNHDMFSLFADISSVLEILE